MPTARRSTRGLPGALVPLLLASAAIAGGPSDVHPQDRGVAREDPLQRHHASAYLPLDHWAYPILDFWIARGRVDRLSPFVRPYRRLEVARAVYRLEGERLPGVEEAWLGRLRREFAPELDVLYGEEEDAAHLSMALRGGAAYRSQSHRDPLRPELEGPFSADRLLEHAFLDGTGQLGVVAGGVRMGRDGIFLHDAQFPDGRVVPRKKAPVLDELGLRVEEAYLELQTKYASVFFGRMYRNWGAPGLPGFIRSDYAYTEEELAYRVGTDRVFLHGTLSSLPDFGGDTTRYLSTHRLEVRPIDEIVLAVTEAVLHGGPSQPLVLAFVNPLGIWHNARRDDDPHKNAVGEVEAWVRPVPGLTLYASWLLDATLRTPGSNFCCQQGLSAGLELSTLAPGLIVRARGSAVQSLTYRTPFPWEEWSVERIGLGWDKTDLYLFTLAADWFRPGGLVLSPRLDLQVRGEGDFREPRPTPEELEDFPNILVGEAETTLRPALAGRWSPDSDLPIDLRWDLGLNVIRDHANQEGDDRSAFVGSVRLVVETPRWIVPLGR